MANLRRWASCPGSGVQMGGEDGSMKTCYGLLERGAVGGFQISLAGWWLWLLTNAESGGREVRKVLSRAIMSGTLEAKFRSFLTLFY
jgi:hypothetical protein